MNAGETKTIKTQKFGDVKVWNWNDKEIHFTWYANGKYEEKGVYDIATGRMTNVPQAMIAEVFAAI